MGSGGTTPLPKIILGANAFNILTLDRFGFWASIIAVPFMAKFIHSFIAGSVKEFWFKNFVESTDRPCGISMLENLRLKTF